MGLRKDFDVFYEAAMQQSPAVQKTLKGRPPTEIDAIAALGYTSKVLCEMILRLADIVDESRGVTEPEDDLS